MSIDAMLSDAALRVRDKMREFVAAVPRQLLLDMDAD